ncbi:MAG: riboflavin synthase [Ignavibacteria bacterium]|nr:riboflavin synthase [Ignavibacteria bacterium]
MFTGIIEEVGKVRRIERFGMASKLSINCQTILNGLEKGFSVAINGVCLTVVNLGRDFFEVDVVEETLRRSNLSKLNVGNLVNLERALKVGDRFNGHIVQGHIDTTGKIVKIVPETVGKLFYFEFPEEFTKLVVDKGSIAVDGISFTIINVKSNVFSVSVIPYTFEKTNFKERNVGDIVNLEFDIIGKYILHSLTKEEKVRTSGVLQQFYEQPY